MKPKTLGILVAVVFALGASAASWFGLSRAGDRDDPLTAPAMVLNLPAVLVYAGTLAEHDPLKGGGAMLFICGQWGAVGAALGWLVSEIWGGLQRARMLRNSASSPSVSPAP